MRGYLRIFVLTIVPGAFAAPGVAEAQGFGYGYSYPAKVGFNHGGGYQGGWNNNFAPSFQAGRGFVFVPDARYQYNRGGFDDRRGNGWGNYRGSNGFKGHTGYRPSGWGWGGYR